MRFPPPLSARSSFDLTLNPLASLRAKIGGEGVLDLTESNPTRAGIPYDADSILGSLGVSSSLVYQPLPFGLPAAREAVAGDLAAHGTDVDPSRVILTASTSEAYAFLFKLLCDPEDEVLVPRPSYPLFEHIARLEAVRMVPYRLAYDGAWHVDLPSVRNALSARTRAIVTVHPNNPTGSYMKRAELEALAEIGLPIVSDEVFARYTARVDPARAASALEVADRAPLVFTLGGLSKLAGLPQMKAAWIAVGGRAERVTEALGRLEVIADAFLSIGTPVQQALGRLLASRDVAEHAMKRRVASNLAAIASAVAGSAVSLLDVEGGWSAVLRLPAIRTEEDWALVFLERDGVYVHPGHFFDFEDGAYVVVSLLTPEATLRAGIKKVIERVDG